MRLRYLLVAILGIITCSCNATQVTQYFVDRGQPIDHTTAVQIARQIRPRSGNGCVDAIKDWWSDQPPSVVNHMIKISWRESRWQSTARNGQHIGCVQIASRVHASRIAKLGLVSSDLFDPQVNAMIGRMLYNESGLHPWDATR
jgi:hypothetical protein